MTWEWCKISGLLPMISRPHYRYVMFVSNCKVRLPRELYQDTMGISTTNYLLGFIMYFSYLGPDKILRRPKMGPRQLSRVPANLSYVTCFCNPTTLRNEHCSFTNPKMIAYKSSSKKMATSNLNLMPNFWLRQNGMFPYQLNIIPNTSYIVPHEWCGRVS